MPTQMQFLQLAERSLANELTGLVPTTYPSLLQTHADKFSSLPNRPLAGLGSGSKIVYSRIPAAPIQGTPAVDHIVDT